MKSTELTRSVANIILIVYFVYALFYIPFNAVLVSTASGLVTYGVTESYEAAVALTLIVGIVFALMVPSKKSTKEGFSGNAVEISKRVQEFKQKTVMEPSGIHASSFVEGFQDLSGASAPSTTSTTTASASSATPAPSTAAPEKITPPPVPSTATPATAGFRSGGTEPDGLFKLGVIPEDSKGGYHIDQGTTVINALNALKPDQVKQMSEDTQKLIDTQKSLMSLLSTVKPMMQDGKQMMDTFQQMFGSNPQANPLG